MSDTLITIVPTAPIRALASDSSEMVSQLLLGEQALLLEKNKQWIKIRSLHDNYEGWADEKGFALWNEYGSRHQGMVTSAILTAENISNKQPLMLGLGSYVNGYNKLDGSFVHDGYSWAITSGKVLPDSQYLDTSTALKTVQVLLNAPYLWGGKTIMGIDCSALTQLFFRLQGKIIPRDASQQVELGNEIPFIQNAEAGDLAFFGNSEGKIIHVGILLSATTILHASGKVKIDAFDQQGIYNKNAQKYTHQLRVVKRM